MSHPLSQLLPRLPIRIKYLSAALLLGALIACGGPSGPKHEYSLVPGRAHSPALETAMILPFNETLDVPKGAEVANENLYQFLVEYVESKSVTVVKLDRVSYRKASGIAANNARKEMMNTTTGKTSATLDFSMMVPHLMKELELDVDLVIVPNTVMRSGKYTGGKAVMWDGVRRRDATARGTMSGTTSVTSVQSLIFDPRGEQIFSGYGGLDLMFEIDFRKEKMVLIEDRLQDLDNLRQGVCTSLHPFFGEGEDCHY